MGPAIVRMNESANKPEKCKMLFTVRTLQCTEIITVYHCTYQCTYSAYQCVTLYSISVYINHHSEITTVWIINLT